MADDFEFLDAETAIFKANKDAWLRDERRLYGADPVLDEDLAQHDGETDEQFELRRKQAHYVNFPEIHAATLAGHLQKEAPKPNFGGLGEIRTREEFAGTDPTNAELIFYNVDGIGSDGDQWHSFNNGVQMRAFATGHRWVFVEMPPLPTKGQKRVSNEDRLAGHRPYLIEWSPAQVPWWEYSHGRLDALIARVPILPPNAAKWEHEDDELGYYLFTRTGFKGFGAKFARGGWWQFDSEKKVVDFGDWSLTKGEIPIVAFKGMPSKGTTNFPSMSRSLTMELGQVAVALMNLASARDFDAFDAAMSVLYLLGAEPEAFKLMVAHRKEGARMVPVPGMQNQQSGQIVVPQLFDGSTGAVASTVFESIVKALISAAHETMVRQITAPDASGAAREIEHNKETSPLLAGCATRRETYENSVIRFLELRAGVVKPSGVVQYPTEFQLAPVLTKIERTIKRMTDSLMTSATLSAELLTRAAVEEGTMPDDQTLADTIHEEFLAAGQRVAAKSAADTMKTLVDAGAPLPFAARLAGLTEEQIGELEEVPEPEPLPGLDDIPAPAVPPVPNPNEE